MSQKTVIRAGVFMILAITTAPRPLLSQESFNHSSSPERSVNGRQLFTAARSGEPIRIDGDLSDVGWDDAAVLSLRWETSPGDNSEARVTTICKVTFDDSNLYLACDAQDPRPNQIRAFVTDRDNIDSHDKVGFTIDPFNDTRRAFQFAITPLGVQSDAILDQQNETDDSWDAIWTSSGRITEHGYVVEAAIPFKSLRFPNSSGVQTWGFSAWRNWPRSDFIEMSSVRLDRGNSCLLCQANLVEGFEGISPGTNLQLVPTVTSSRTDRREQIPGGPITNGAIDGEPGLDLRWGITTDFTLSGTLNPDFSQVEADAAQLDINNRFALFFDEKRPFFLEGADFFDTPLSAVFTRTIVDPIFGSKGTGKIGANAVGGMITRDQSPGLLIPSNQGSSSAALNSDVTSVIGRFRRDIGASSTIGALYTGREGLDYSNRVGGVDGFLRPTNTVTIDLQLLRSQTDYPDQLALERGQATGAFNGNAFMGRATWQTRDWRLTGRVQQLDAGFRADAGFIGQVDLRMFNIWGERKIWGEEGDWYSRINLAAGTWHEESVAGRLSEQGVWTNFYYEGPLQTSGWFNPSFVREYYDGQVHDLYRLRTELEMQPSGNLGFGFGINTGDAVDYANSRKAFRLELRPSVNVRVGRHLDVNVSHNFQRLSTRGAEIFTANLTELRTVYNFSTRLFFRAIAQYRDTNRNPVTNVVAIDIDRQGLFTQFLLSYKVNPQTVAFLGYSDSRSGFVNEDSERADLTLEGRTVFVKFGYAWRP